MGVTFRTILCALAVLAATVPSTADSGAPGGGDREPAGGAFMSSFPKRDGEGMPPSGPPRSVDVPRDPAGRPLGRYPGGELYRRDGIVR